MTVNNKEDNFFRKQWWAPVWTGLLMDSDAKHYLKMKNALWLFLYLVLNANRRGGFLSRKVKTICSDMGVCRGTILRWIDILRKQGYISTANTGRALFIQIKKWKSLPEVPKMRYQRSQIYNNRGWKNVTPEDSPLSRISRSFSRQKDEFRRS